MTVGKLKALLAKIPDTYEVDIAIPCSGVASGEIVVTVSRWSIEPYVMIGEYNAIYMSAAGMEEFSVIDEG
jgi:hypothetical protein